MFKGNKSDTGSCMRTTQGKIEGVVVYEKCLHLLSPGGEFIELFKLNGTSGIWRKRRKVQMVAIFARIPLLVGSNIALKRSDDLANLRANQNIHVGFLIE